MKQAIIGWSLYIIVTEPKTSYFYKVFDKVISYLELYFSAIEIHTIYKTITP